jgi:hypothetical protein
MANLGAARASISGLRELLSQIHKGFSQRVSALYALNQMCMRMDA